MIELREVSKTVMSGSEPLTILHPLSLEIPHGQFVAIVAQAWWASFGLRERTHWDFVAFAIILAQMCLVYMAAALIFPDIPSSGDVDLSDHWERHRGAFFGFVLAMLAASILKSIALDDRLPSTSDTLFHLLLAVIAVVGIVIRSARVQLLIACTSALVLIAYVGLLFAHI